jgi:hypothetical protein
VSRRRIVGATIGVVAVLLAVGVTCRREGRDATPPASEHASHDLSPTRAPAVDPVRDEAEPQREPATDAKSPASEQSTYARVTAGRREHDLRLLADVQRHLDGPPPPAVERLLALRDEGVDEDALARHIDEQVEGMMVQAACRRWLARERGDAQGSRIGEGGRAPAVKPLERREQ